MKVSGFTFVRNVVQFDYPVVEAISSVLPLCDEFVIALGKSDDTTELLIRSINSPKIKIINTIWNETLRIGGKVFAEETDKAFRNINPNADWAFYIQADEVLHEKYLPIVKEAMVQYKDNKSIEGLLFDYVHFYGSYDYIGDGSSWYRREVRIIRNKSNIRSYRDAQGFRKHARTKLKVKHINASIYHYGWVKHPQIMYRKQRSNERLNYGENWDKEAINQSVDTFDYSTIDSIRLFKETHPKVMKARIDEKNWNFNYDFSKHNKSTKEKIKRWLRQSLGWYVGEFRNYKII